MRPIAIGEVFKRIAAKCLVARFQSEEAQGLAPLQVGVGIPGAAEAIIHKLHQWHRQAKSGHGFLAIDFSNAFNTVDRNAMLEAIARRCPRFLPYAWFCYGGGTPLQGDGFCITSAQGTQQGDACGPLFFSVTLQGVLETAQVPGLEWTHLSG